MTTNGIFPGVVRVQDAGVAQRHRILASYEVAGRVSKQAVRPGGTPDFRRPVRTDSVLKPTPGTWCRANFLDVVWVQDAGVAQRHRILASYEVAGRVSKKVVRPGGTPDFRRPVRTDSVLKPTPGTWCRANFPCRFATAETSKNPSIHQSINPSIHQSTNPPIHQATNPPIHQSTKPPSHQATKPPSHQSIKPPSHQSTKPPIHQSINPPIHQSTNPSIHQSINPSIHQSINPSIHQSINPSIHQSINPPIHQSINPSIHQSINPPIHQSINPPIHQSINPPIHQSTNPFHPPSGFVNRGK